MHRLEEYVSAGGKLLRCGYTTGTCAAAATSAATELLLAGTLVPSVVVSTPAGIDVAVDIEDADRGPDSAWAEVRKDAGDDPDVTDGVTMRATVARTCEAGIVIDGGIGVGRVTRAGLDQTIGAAAINTTPRAMIAQAARSSAEAHGYHGGLAVEISIPEGIALAERTFNPKLGIVGGISVLGTSGIVRPMSEEALVASIRMELAMLRGEGVRHLLVVPGNYGRDFAHNALGLAVERAVTCSNYLGETIDEAALLGFETLLVIGHAGKLVKVAAGVMNTHSRVADARAETLAAHAACAGASGELVRTLMNAATTDAAIELLEAAGLREQAMSSLMDRMGAQLAHRAANTLQVEALMFSNRFGILGMTTDAHALLAHHRCEGGGA